MSITNDYQKINLKQRTVSLVSIFALLFSNLFFTTGTNAAVDFDQPASPGQILDARILQETLSCFNNKYGAGTEFLAGNDVIRRKISLSEANSMNLFNRLSNDGADNLTAGYDLKSVIAEADDGVIECEDLEAVLPGVIDRFYGNRLLFIEQFYDREDTDTFRLKESSTHWSATSALRSTALIISLDTGDIELARRAIAFSRCFQESNLPVEDSSTPDLGKSYILRNGMSLSSQVPIGTFGSSEGGQRICSNLSSPGSRPLVDLLERIGISTGAARNNPHLVYLALGTSEQIDETLATARARINALLSGNPNGVRFCLASVPLPERIALSQITEWLVTGDVSKLNWQTGSMASDSADEDEAARLLGCLIAPEIYGEELESILIELEADITAAQAALAAARAATDNDATGQVDACLSSDEFLGWFVCPIVNVMVDIIEWLERIIEGALKFKLSEIGTDETATNAMKTSWNIFRSLATVLIVIAFLLALLVKAIKGE
jgi:hypothetical protein